MVIKKPKIQNIALWGILFFLPFQSVMMYDLGILTLKMSQIFLLIGVVVLFFSKRLFGKQWAILFLLLPPILSLLNSVVPMRTITLIFALTLLFVLYVVVFRLTIKVDKKLIINTIVWSGVISSIYGIYQYVGFEYFGIDTGIIFNPWDVAPKISSFSVPNQFANFLLLPIIISLYATVMSKKIRQKFSYFFSFIVCMIALFLTVSSGGIVAILIGLLIFGLIVNKRIRLYTIIMLYLSTLFLLIFYMINSFDVFNNFSSFWSIRTGERYMLWETALRLFSENFIFGIGLDNFPVLAPNFLYYLKVEQHKEIHNTLLTILTETGVVGLMIYLSGFIVLLRKGFKAIKVTTNKENRALIASLIVVVLAMSLQYLTDNGLYVMHFWTTIALLSAFSAKEMEQLKINKQNHPE